MTIAEIDTLLNKQSGLKGMAGVNDFPRTGAAPVPRAMRRLSWRSRYTSIGSSTTSARTLALLGGLDVLQLHRRGRGEQPGSCGRRCVDGLGWTRLPDGSRAQRRTLQVARVISPDRRADHNRWWSLPTRSWRSPGKPPRPARLPLRLVAGANIERRRQTCSSHSRLAVWIHRNLAQTAVSQVDPVESLPVLDMCTCPLRWNDSRLGTTIG